MSINYLLLEGCLIETFRHLAAVEDMEKSEKKKKNKKSKKSKSAEDVQQPQATVEETAMAVDAEGMPSIKTCKGILTRESTEPPILDSEKKKKKRKKHAEEGEPMSVDTERMSLTYLGILTLIMTIIAAKPHSEEPEKKKKKRKREEQEDETGGTVAPSTSESKNAKKDKKKRRKEEAASTSTSAEPSSAPPKAVPPPAKSAPKVVASAADAAAFLEKHSVTITTPPGVPAVTPITDFAQLDVPKELSSSFKGFKEPTPIQACTWPPALEGRDVVGIAETGRYVINHSLIFPYTNHPIAVKRSPSAFLHSAASSIHRQRLQNPGNQQ